MHDLDLKLERVRLVAPFDLGSMVEALVMYRDVELVVDDDGELQRLIDWFTPSGILTFFEEFHESVIIRTRSEGVSGLSTRDIPMISMTIGDLRYLHHIDPNLVYMRDHSCLVFDQKDPSRVLGSWYDPRVDDFLARIEDIPWIPGDFLENIFEDMNDLAIRYRAYLSAIGRPQPSPIKFTRVEFAHNSISSYTIADESGAERLELRKSFYDYINDRLITYGPRMVSPCHLIASRSGAFLLAYDSYALLNRLQAAVNTSEYLFTSVIPGMPRISDALTRYPALTDQMLLQIARTRRRLMKLPEDARLDDVLNAVLKTPWFSRLPVKVARWSILTGGGIILDLSGAHGMGTITGVSLSALDSFLLDRIAQLWRPDQYLLGYRESLEKLAKRLSIPAHIDDTPGPGGH